LTLNLYTASLDELGVDAEAALENQFSINSEINRARRSN